MPLHPCSSLHRATSMTVRMYAGGATRFEAGQVENTSIDVRDASSIMVPHPVQRQGIPRMTLCPYLASLRVQNRLQYGRRPVVGRDRIRNEIRRGDIELVEQRLDSGDPGDILTGVAGESETAPIVFLGINGDDELHASSPATSSPCRIITPLTPRRYLANPRRR